MARRKKGAPREWQICAECVEEKCEHAFVHPDVVIPWILPGWDSTGEVSWKDIANLQPPQDGGEEGELSNVPEDWEQTKW
jgi:hypothetical protein